MAEDKPDDIEDVSDGDLEEIKKEPEYKEASLPEDLWKSWLERRKTGATVVGTGVGMNLGGQEETGKEEDWSQPVILDNTYIGKPNSKDKENESK